MKEEKVRIEKEKVNFASPGTAYASGLAIAGKILRIWAQFRPYVNKMLALAEKEPYEGSWTPNVEVYSTSAFREAALDIRNGVFGTLSCMWEWALEEKRVWGKIFSIDEVLEKYRMMGEIDRKMIQKGVISRPEIKKHYEDYLVDRKLRDNPLWTVRMF